MAPRIARGADRSPDDVVGGRRVGLAGGEADDVHAGRAQRVRALGDREDRVVAHAGSP
jgi:hypothetical protein